MITNSRPHLLVVATLSLTGALTLASALAAQTSGWRGQPTANEPVIEVSGQGETHVAPDRATVILSVETKGPTAAAVAAANARVQHRVLDTLRALGYSGTQVSTISYNVQPNYELVSRALRPQQRGYLSRNSVRVKLTQLDRIGAVIDAALAGGATGVQDVEFDATKTDAARQAALTEAAAKARADAMTLAKAMGGTLGRLVAITTQDQPVYSGGMAARAAYDSTAQTPITPDEVPVEASVIARWQFVPAP